MVKVSLPPDGNGQIHWFFTAHQVVNIHWPCVPEAPDCRQDQDAPSDDRPVLLEVCLHRFSPRLVLSARHPAVRREGQCRAAAPAVADSAWLQPWWDAAFAARRAAEL